MPQNWFNQNAPKQTSTAPGGWFSRNALTPDEADVVAGSPPRQKPSLSEMLAPKAVTPPPGPPLDLNPADPMFAPVDVLKSTREGAQQIGRGIMADPSDPMLPKVYTNPLLDPALGGEEPVTAWTPAQMAAKSDVVEGAFKLGEPAIAAGLLMNPLTTGVGLAAMSGTSAAASKGVEMLGGGEEAQRLTGNVAGLLLGPLAAKGAHGAQKSITGAIGLRSKAGKIASGLEESLAQPPADTRPRLVKPAWARRQAIEADATTAAAKAGVVQEKLKRGELAPLEPNNPDLVRASKRVSGGAPMLPARIADIPQGTVIIDGIGTPGERQWTIAAVERGARGENATVLAADNAGNVLELAAGGRPGADLAPLLENIVAGRAQVFAPGQAPRPLEAQTPRPTAPPPPAATRTLPVAPPIPPPAAPPLEPVRPLPEPVPTVPQGAPVGAAPSLPGVEPGRVPVEPPGPTPVRQEPPLPQNAAPAVAGFQVGQPVRHRDGRVGTVVSVSPMETPGQFGVKVEYADGSRAGALVGPGLAPPFAPTESAAAPSPAAPPLPAESKPPIVSGDANVRGNLPTRAPDPPLAPAGRPVQPGPPPGRVATGVRPKKPSVPVQPKPPVAAVEPGEPPVLGAQGKKRGVLDPRAAVESLSAAERREVRRILAELDEVQSVRATTRPLEEGERRSAGGFGAEELGILENQTNRELVHGHGNAPVYQDIVGTLGGEATKIRGIIENALKNGNDASVLWDRVVDVAKRRAAGDRRLLKNAILPPEAGDEPGAKWWEDSFGKEARERLAAEEAAAAQAAAPPSPTWDTMPDETFRPMYEVLKKTAEIADDERAWADSILSEAKRRGYEAEAAKPVAEPVQSVEPPPADPVALPKPSVPVEPKAPTYADELIASREASRVFRQAKEDYRAKRIDDAEFMAASDVYKAAERRFDEAFAAEQKRERARKKPSVPVKAKAETSDVLRLIKEARPQSSELLHDRWAKIDRHLSDKPLLQSDIKAKTGSVAGVVRMGLDLLVEIGRADRVWDEAGNVFYVRKGSKPSGFLSQAEADARFAPPAEKPPAPATPKEEPPRALTGMMQAVGDAILKYADEKPPKDWDGTPERWERLKSDATFSRIYATLKIDQASPKRIEQLRAILKEEGFSGPHAVMDVENARRVELGMKPRKAETESPEVAPATPEKPAAAPPKPVPVEASEKPPAPVQAKTTPEGPAKPSDLSLEDATRAHSGTSWVPDERGAQEQKSYAYHVNSLYEQAKKKVQTPAQQESLDAAIETYRQGYLAKLKAQLAASSRVLSTMIAGPSKFNVRGNEKRSATETARRRELLEWDERARVRVFDAVRGARTAEQVTEESWLQIRKEIDRSLGTVKSIDAKESPFVRSAFTTSIKGKLERMAANGELEAVARALAYIREHQNPKRPFFADSNGVWDLVERAKLERADAPAPKTGVEDVATFADGTVIVNNHDAARVQITMPSKPAPDVINALKREGWKWSPSNAAWQRQNTENAVESARRIMRKFSAEAKSEAPAGPVVDDLKAKKLEMPDELRDDINLIGEERDWRKAIDTVGATVRAESDGFTGKVVEPAKDPINGQGRDAMVGVKGSLPDDPGSYTRYYRSTDLKPAAAKADVLDAGEPLAPGRVFRNDKGELEQMLPGGMEQLADALKQQPVIADKAGIERLIAAQEAKIKKVRDDIFLFPHRQALRDQLDGLLDGLKELKRAADPGAAAKQVEAKKGRDQAGLFDAPDTFSRGGGGSEANVGMFDETNFVRPGRMPAGARIEAAEFPELVDVARELIGTPTVVKAFRKAGKLGEFSVFGIKLNSSLFREGQERQLAAVIAHEIGHAIDWLPTKTLKRGNLLGRLETLRDFLKHTFTAPDGHTVLLGPVKKELQALSDEWRPWDKATASASFKAYRNSGKELYADAISVLFNNPGMLEEKAPTFYKEFFEALDRKPEVRRAYFDLQARLSGTREELVARRRAGVREMFEEGDVTALELEKRRQVEADARKKHLWFRLKTEAVDRNYRVLDAIDAAKKRGERIPEDVDPRYLLEERNYLGAKLKAFTERHFAPVFKSITDARMDWQQFGEALFYDRIIAGDRSELANPRGLSPKAAEELKTTLLADLTPAQREVLRRNLKAFRAAVKTAAEDAYDAGLYSAESWADIQKNPAYATFQVLEHLEDGLSSKLHHQIGTLKDIANPADSTILKTLITMRATEHQRVKRGVLDFLTQHEPTSIEDAKTVWTGKGHRPIEPKDKNQRLVTYFDRGALKGKYVDPYIADILDNEAVGRNAAILETVKLANNKVFRPVFTTFNLGFQGFNFLRDLFRFWKNTPSMTVGRALKRYWDAVPLAKARGYGITDKTLETVKRDLLDAEESRILGVTFNDVAMGRHVEDTQIADILTRTGIGGFSTAPRSALSRSLGAAFDFVRETGDFIESLPKAAAIYEVKGQGPISAIPPSQRSFIRRKVGSPDFLAGGTWKPVTNELFLFSNAITQAVRADLEVATQPTTRAGFWWKTAAANMLPKVMMAGAVAGYFGDDVKRMMRRVSEYDATNYTVIPLGESGGDTVYLRIPQDDSGRLAGALFWKMMKLAGGDAETLKSLAQVVDYTAGQFPGVTPSVKLLGDGVEFLSGRNPHDDFRGRNVFTDEEWRARDWKTVKKFLGYEFQQLGGGILWKFYPGEDKPQQKSAGQKFLELPVVSNVLGRFIRITDYGETEKIRSAQERVARDEARQRAQEKTSVFDAIRNGEKNPKTGARDISRRLYGNDFAEAKDRRPSIEARLKVGVARNQADPVIDAILSATSTAQKVAIIQEARQGMSAEQYTAWEKDAIKLGVLSPALRKALRTAQRPSVSKWMSGQSAR
jgi:hypothetical protein